MAPTLQQCPVCFNHYRSTPDGKLCRHGGKVKGQECSGSRKKVDPSGARAASPLGAAPDPKPRLSTRSTAASVSSDPLDLDYSGVFDKLTAVLKCVPVYDHIPKPCREKFVHDLNALLTAVCNDPGDPAHWVRLHCFVPYVLQKTSRGGRRVNQGNLVNKRLSEYSTISLETLGNLSSAVRLVCSPESLAESSPATFDKWDVTVSGTLAERYVNLTSKECGLAAARAADEKMKKYGNALPSMEFLPICIEVLGLMDPNTLTFLKAIFKMISVRSGDSRELFFATNHISCLLQRFLRVCVLENIQLNADMCN
ncbi:hypothetical protein HELRODRAFT_158363 [Helobdella robusta]|uniref:Uncharacterized protein n=1 Tax=Helobdella robusta TaxID=6412 RepID=T1EMP8_HELRO|nr:hypothetical protein HELRODRAFT_158363 [Helobdella robusta]ESO11982.1 hypothetical protein HELRODRAFT_158363 [Helobdella robusta]